MMALRHAACVLLAAASLLASPANATSFSTDQSDLYYIADLTPSAMARFISNASTSRDVLSTGY